MKRVKARRKKLNWDTWDIVVGYQIRNGDAEGAGLVSDAEMDAMIATGRRHARDRRVLHVVCADTDDGLARLRHRAPDMTFVGFRDDNPNSQASAFVDVLMLSHVNVMLLSVFSSYGELAWTLSNSSLMYMFSDGLRQPVGEKGYLPFQHSGAVAPFTYAFSPPALFSNAEFKKWGGQVSCFNMNDPSKESRYGQQRLDVSVKAQLKQALDRIAVLEADVSTLNALDRVPPVASSAHSILNTQLHVSTVCSLMIFLHLILDVHLSSQRKKSIDCRGTSEIRM